MAAETARPQRHYWREFGREVGSALLIAFLLSLVLYECLVVVVMLAPSEPPHTPSYRIMQVPIILPMPTMQQVSPSPNTFTSLPPQPR